MAITRVNGTKGTKGTNGKNPTKGSNGGDAVFTQNGQIGADSITVQANGGDGGAGGNANAAGNSAGGDGGNGGDANINVNGNIFNAPATANLTVSLTATGGDGGNGGTSVNSTPGHQGDGGNASVVMNGNIIQPSRNMNTITLDAVAVGGNGTNYGNATATINGNIVQPTKANNVFLEAIAYSAGPDDPSHDGDNSFGIKTATVSGNIVQGNVNNAWLSADAYSSNGTANLTGNIVQTNANNTGTVTLEASGQHIDIEKNKVTLGKQELDLTIGEYGPSYDAKIKGNEFTGTGTNTFVFTDNAIPGPLTTPDTIAIDLDAQTFVFNGDNNKLKSFANVTVNSDNAATITGSSAANILTGGNGDDTISGLGGNDTIYGSGGNDLITGGAGNDSIDGGDGLFDTAVYSGNFNQYTLNFVPMSPTLSGTVTDNTPGRDGTDTLQNVEFLKFANGLYDVAGHTFIPNNHPPVAVDDSYNTSEDVGLAINIPPLSVLANDTDAENDPLTASLVSTASHGTLTFNSDGTFVYTPDQDYNGVDTFTYKANDGTSDSNVATVTINVGSVNDAPAGADKTITTLEDTAYTFTAADFGFSDPQDAGSNAGANNFAAVKITTLPGALTGSLTDNGVAVTAGQSVSIADINTGKLVFTPAANANGNAEAAFTFQVQDDGPTGGLDQNLDQSPNTITFNVTPVNDAPVAVNDTYSTSEDVSFSANIPPIGVLNNDTDVDGDPLTSILVNPTSHGTVTLNSDGTFLYTPDQDYNGSDSFSYKANDGLLDSNVATVTINVGSVNDAPEGADHTVSGQLNTPYIFTVSDFGFTDPQDAGSNAGANNFFAVKITTLPANGVLLDNGVPVTTAGSFVSAADIAAGLLVFLPAPNASGPHYGDFTFQVQDDGPTGGLDQNLDQSPNTMTINVSNGQTFTGTPGPDNLMGGPGDDTFIASTGNDTYNGNGGTDTLVFNSSTGPLTVDLSNPNPQAIGGGYGTDTILNIENIDASATSSNNTFTGADLVDNVLTGGSGDDTFIITGGHDTIDGGGNSPVGDTADFHLFAGGVTIDLNNAGPQSLGGGDTVALANIENLTGGAGDDTFTDMAGANNTYVGAGGTDTVKFATPLSATTIAWNGAHFTVTGANGTDTTDVEVLQGSSGPKTLLVGGPGGFATINDAIAAASNGDTILIAPGTYNENVNVNKSVTLQGAAPGVIIEGTFTEDNGNFAGPLSTWLQTAPGYSNASGIGVAVSADNVTLKNLTVDDFFHAVETTAGTVSGLTLDGVTMNHSLIDFTKPDTTALNNVTITNSTFSDGYIGAGFFNDTGDGLSKDVTDTTITNSTFQDIDTKGIYMETAQGNTTLTGLTMNNVGAYGGIPSFGSNGANGNGIDLNLKYHTYTGTVDISGFDMTNVGSSAGQNGAIVVEGRDDAPSYSGIPADVSGLDVNIHDGTINGTSTGVRAGEIKPGGDTGPATDITNVTVTGATVSDIDNHTNSLMTVTGTAGNDHYVATQNSIGPINISGLDGDDVLGGGGGNDTILGGAGNDTLFASGGTDTLNGGANSDTADFSLLTQGVNISLGVAGFQSLGAIGQVKLASIENLNGTNFNDVLSGSTGNNIINGNDGDDTFLTSGGKDTFDGGAGNNTLDLSLLGAGVTINLASAGAQNVGGTDTVRLANIQNLTGTGFDDTLKGDANNNILIGGVGNDTMTGGGGTLDIFFGGAGDDTITGSAATVTDVAYYAGLETGHTIGTPNNLGNNNVANTVTVSGGTDGNDTLTRVDRLKFLSPSHVSDLDNNGLGDLVYQNTTTGAISYVAHPGTTQKTLSTVPGANWNVIGAGQFTPDANGVKARASGILLQDSGTGDMEVITGIANANSTSTLLSSPTGTFSGWNAITTGDFNGDASSDILLQKATGEVEIAFLTGVKNEAIGTVDSIQSVTAPDTSGNWRVVASGDFDADGHSDILFRNTANNDIVVDTMRGSTIESSASFSPGNTLTAVATGDFNGDGTSDILFQKNDGSAVIWTMNGTTQTGTITGPGLANPGGTFTLAGAEDIDGDGVSDLIWHDNTGATKATMMLAGGTVGATNTIGIAAPNTLHLIASTGAG